MLDNLVMIIPTYNRREYLCRVVEYYSSFPCKVYICDSSKEKADVENVGNVIYRWVPQSSFYEKILDVLNETAAEYYALSPDDDFIKISTLLECLSALEEDEQYAAGIGRQLKFMKPFDGSFVCLESSNGLANIMKECFLSENDYVKYVAENYQNILWSLYRRSVILKSFQILDRCSFLNGNFIEIILCIETLKAGKFYLSNKGFNYRENATQEHWGTIELPITYDNIQKDCNLKIDMMKFKNYYHNDMIANLWLTSYMDERERISNMQHWYIFGYILAILKKFVRILGKRGKNYNRTNKFYDDDMALLISKVTAE